MATKMKAFTKDNLPMLRIDIDRALKEIGEKWGVSMKMGNIRFTDQSFSGKIEAALADATQGGDPREAKWAADYKRYAALYEMPPNMVGKPVVFNGSEFTLLGYNTRGKTYPIMARNIADGKVYKLPRQAVGGKPMLTKSYTFR